MKRELMSTFLITAFAIGMIGCEQEGPAERAGAKVDEAVEKAGDKIEQAADNIEEKTDR